MNHNSWRSSLCTLHFIRVSGLVPDRGRKCKTQSDLGSSTQRELETQDEVLRQPCLHPRNVFFEKCIWTRLTCLILNATTLEGRSEYGRVFCLSMRRLHHSTHASRGLVLAPTHELSLNCRRSSGHSCIPSSSKWCVLW
jgi:hypothetical protein